MDRSVTGSAKGMLVATVVALGLVVAYLLGAGGGSAQASPTTTTTDQAEPRTLVTTGTGRTITGAGRTITGAGRRFPIQIPPPPNPPPITTRTRRPVWASKPKLKSFWSSSLPMTIEPSAPAFSAICRRPEGAADGQGGPAQRRV